MAAPWLLLALVAVVCAGCARPPQPAALAQGERRGQTVALQEPIRAAHGEADQAPDQAPRQTPAGAGALVPASEAEVILATTTSTQDSGLLDVLVPLFERRTGYRVKTIGAGTGAALALGARGEADVVLVHAPEAERRWMAQGNGTERLLVMHNDFVLVGPESDPAGVRTAPSVLDALQRIADRRARWISRDDNSGTDQMEKALWAAAERRPAGQPWYVASSQGMAATLLLADQKEAYTLSDRATYLARRRALRLAVLAEGDSRLLNVYHVLPVNAAKAGNHRVNAPGGRAFAAFLVGAEAQRAIGAFGRERYGQPLFIPDAGKREADLGV